MCRAGCGAGRACRIPHGNSSFTEEQREAQTRRQPCRAHGAAPGPGSPQLPFRDAGSGTRPQPGGCPGHRKALPPAEEPLHLLSSTPSPTWTAVSLLLHPRGAKPWRAPKGALEGSTAHPPRPRLLGPGHLRQEATPPTWSHLLPVTPSVRASPGLGAALRSSQMCLISGGSLTHPRCEWRLQHLSRHLPPQLPAYLSPSFQM